MSNRQDVPVESEDDRRKNSRFPLRAHAQMQYSSKKWEAHVLDISSSGARLAILSEHLLRKGDTLRVQIMLNEQAPDDSVKTVNTAKKSVNLHGRLAHVREHILGYEFQPDTPADKSALDELLLVIAEDDHPS
jgi:hypothetical protein